MERATLVGPKCGARKRYTVGGEAHERETGDPCCSTTASLGISGGRMEGGGARRRGAAATTSCYYSNPFSWLMGNNNSLAATSEKNYFVWKEERGKWRREDRELTAN